MNTENNKQIVLEAFDTLFNKPDYTAAERFWSPDYIQHSAHIHHRGQLSTYLRSLGAEVPSIYGPSGDEPFQTQNKEKL